MMTTYLAAMKPFVTCHILGSVDGRIRQTIWGLKDHHLYFEIPAAKIPADAWLVGRITMQEFSSKRKYRLPPAHKNVPKTDFVAQHRARTFAVVVDPEGKCRWDNNMVSTEHVIEVLTKRVSQAYLQHLREKNVSYVFAGKTKIDLDLTLRKLHRLFHIRRLRVDGGGHINGSFLKAGLIDEVSLVLAPVADGTTGSLSAFEAEEGYGKRLAARLKIKSVKKIFGDFLWIRYAVVRRG
jgi:riboflavin biosynthesis pyrimidine reductase